ncbi:MAG: type restriction enzyme [Thermotogaceae bacterium]|nr:type restriction enzyme [Thermotogaceae bacterium]
MLRNCLKTMNCLGIYKSVYDHVIYDSDNEAAFAAGLESNNRVKVYAKLPDWFKIETPIGTYNPDWAVLFEKDGEERLYLVVETKGNVHDEALRPTEKLKIKCGERHFAAIQTGVRFEKTEGYEDLIKKIAFGSESDITHQTKSVSHTAKINNQRRYRITVEKNYWDSFSIPNNQKTICYAEVDSNFSVTLYKGQNDPNNHVNYNNIPLSSNESKNILDILNCIVSDPITAKKRLNNSDKVFHVGHNNPIYVTVESFDNPNYSDGTVVFSWDCNAMDAKNGFLKDIIEHMKL